MTEKLAVAIAKARRLSLSSGMESFIQQLCTAVRQTTGGTADDRRLIGRAVADTLSVAAAGFAEPVVRAAMAAYGGNGPQNWAGEGCDSQEAAVMINATAAHALDFDDVFLDSTAHPSAVIVPVVWGFGATGGDPLAGLAAGLIAGRAVAMLLGPGHYRRGWHGTGTIGAFAATAAAGRMAGLDAAQLRSAFALAAAMSGGLQANFSTMAKPCQAGFAAAAGFRAVRLAAAGVTGAGDVFAQGYRDLYGDAEAVLRADVFALMPHRLAVKLYPSCYAANRLIGVALDARRQLGAIFGDPQVEIRLSVPAGSLEVLRYPAPVNGMQARFSAPFNTCAALIDGAVTIPHFEDAAVGRADLRAAMTRLTIVEDEAQDSRGDIRFGQVTLEVLRGGQTMGRFVRSAIPGSADDPPSPQDIAAKSHACLEIFEAHHGRAFGLDGLTGGMEEARMWLEAPSPSGHSAK